MVNRTFNIYNIFFQTLKKSIWINKSSKFAFRSTIIDFFEIDFQLFDLESLFT